MQLATRQAAVEHHRRLRLQERIAMSITREIIVYDGPGGPFEGMAVRDTAVTVPQPGIMLVPNVLGTKEQDFAKAEDVAALGYVVFVADVFGQGKRTSRDDPANMGRYMNELTADRSLLRERLKASLDTLKSVPGCDAGKTAAMGFCFGGMCVLDMTRAGLGLAGAVSFHGTYGRPDYANVTPIATRILVCHGWKDPFCPPEATVALANELTEGEADWQIHAYGHAAHAFTDTELYLPDMGILYEEKANRRSWLAMVDFFEEVFG
jgi:dienelactone hydrolase